MFSRAVPTRLASTTTAHGAIKPTSSSAARCSIAARGHQRRPSSSKASIPPNEDDAPVKRVVGSSSKATTKTTAPRKARGKASKITTTAPSPKGKWEQPPLVPLNKLFPDLPQPVRSTNHLKEADVALMNLFAGHLPISPNTVIPPSASDAQFDAVFTPRPSWHKHVDNINAINTIISDMDPAASSEEAVIHLDALKLTQRDPLQDYYKYNRPPPPPQPIEDLEAEQARLMKTKKGRKGKSWQTTITVTEWINGTGHRIFRTDTTPIFRIPPSTQTTLQKVIEDPIQQQITIRQPFLERMRARHMKMMDTTRSRVIRSPLGKQTKMILISVKRQRKHKMKKHKLKKLRKRTRNLRRKLGKL